MKKVKSKKKTQKGGDSNGWFAKSEYSPVTILLIIVLAMIVGVIIGNMWGGGGNGEDPKWMREGLTPRYPKGHEMAGHVPGLDRR